MYPETISVFLSLAYDAHFSFDLFFQAFLESLSKQ
ncbi:hypothetical protein DFP80_12235 [Marinomonas rhizomae]|uniref:Uncharacterized protein n=1 Tax=Marinomonas rhizomae TaxID=491948 RepID=A0A366ITC9_9GAMM|nr:hypothetical protein DFP80_12235 [Marinomonas rhizomae]